MNVYVYSTLNPVAEVDPTGLQSVTGGHWPGMDQQFKAYSESPEGCYQLCVAMTGAPPPVYPPPPPVFGPWLQRAGNQVQKVGTVTAGVGGTIFLCGPDPATKTTAGVVMAWGAVTAGVGVVIEWYGGILDF